MPYDFDALVGFNHARVLTDVLEFARAVNAREIEIVGYRGARRASRMDRSMVGGGDPTSGNGVPSSWRCCCRART